MKKLLIITVLVLSLFNFSNIKAEESGAVQNENSASKLPAEAIANGPDNCESRSIPKDKGEPYWATPVNCVFLDEPIGGKIGYDLYIEQCEEEKCTTTLWNGEYFDKTNTRGPIQAILSFEKDKEYESSFGLLYHYLKIIYKFMTGIIVLMAVFFIVLAGVEISVAMGDTEAVSNAKKKISKVIIGMIIWFTASLILYTINPTFFTF